MLDIQTLRNDLAGVAARLKSRGFELDTAKLEKLEAERKTIQTRTQELQAKRNATSKMIGQAKAKGEDVSAIMAEVGALGDELKQLEAKQPQVLADMEAFLAIIPEGGRLFDPQVQRSDPAGLDIHLEACPLKDAWEELDLSEEDRITMCRIAGEIDKGTFEAAGFQFQPDTWQPGRSGCCHLHIRPGT